MKFVQVKGFTLIEMLLYVGISSVMLLSLSTFFAELLNVSVKNQTINEVNEQGIHVMELVTQLIRNAKTITTPTVGTSSTSLTITVRNASSSPTLFDLATGTLRIKEGSSQYVELTNSKVIVSSLNFTNTSASSTDGGSVDVSFILTYVASSSLNQYMYSKPFNGSASFH